MQTEPASAKRQSQVTTSCEKLNKAITAVYGVADCLEKRLDSVLSAAVSHVEDKQAEKPTPCIVPLAEEIRAGALEVLNLANRLASLIDRIEL